MYVCIYLWTYIYIYIYMYICTNVYLCIFISLNIYILVILGDFNASVERDCSSLEGVLGRHGVSKINDNGILLHKCAEHSFCITNTLFRIADKYKTTCIHPRPKPWNLIDFIIVRQRDIRDVRVTRAMIGAECWTDHRLVWPVLTLPISQSHGNRPKTARAAYNVASLKDPS